MENVRSTYNLAPLYAIFSIPPLYEQILRRSRDNVVNIRSNNAAADWTIRNSNSCKDKGLFPYPKYPDRFSDSPSFLQNLYRNSSLG